MLGEKAPERRAKLVGCATRLREVQPEQALSDAGRLLEQPVVDRFGQGYIATLYAREVRPDDAQHPEPPCGAPGVRLSLEGSGGGPYSGPGVGAARTQG